MIKCKSINHIWNVFDEKRTHLAAKKKLVKFLKKNILKKMLRTAKFGLKVEDRNLNHIK
jgi:hypothetical protein